MIPIIIICIVVFALVILLFNFRRIVDAIKNKKKSKQKPTEVKPVKKNDDGVTMDEDLAQKKIDDLKNRPVENLTVEPFVVADENELKELEAKSHRSGGRRSGDIKSISNIDVQVEELEDDNKEEDYLNTQTKTNTVANQIKNLPPEIKALLLSNIFDKKD